jgi:hypothetical protein
MELKRSRFLLSHSRRSLSKASSLRFLLSSGDETLYLIAMRVSNEHVRPLESTGRRTPTPTGFTEIVSDDFAVLHAGDPYLEQIADAGRINSRPE